MFFYFYELFHLLTFSLCLLAYLWAGVVVMPCYCLLILYKKLSAVKNCQTHRSYVIFPFESTGVFSFRVTCIFKQLV